MTCAQKSTWRRYLIFQYQSRRTRKKWPHTKQLSFQKKETSSMVLLSKRTETPFFCLTLDLDADPCQCEAQRVASLYEWFFECLHALVLTCFPWFTCWASNAKSFKVWNMEYEARKRRTNRLEHLGTTSLREKGCNRRMPNSRSTKISNFESLAEVSQVRHLPNCSKYTKWKIWPWKQRHDSKSMRNSIGNYCKGAPWEDSGSQKNCC